KPIRQRLPRLASSVASNSTRLLPVDRPRPGHDSGRGRKTRWGGALTRDASHGMDGAHYPRRGAKKPQPHRLQCRHDVTPEKQPTKEPAKTEQPEGIHAELKA